MSQPFPPKNISRSGAANSILRSPSNGSAHKIELPSENQLDARDVQQQPEETELLRAENDQLRALCTELEQALQEAAHSGVGTNAEERFREYETLLEEKTETIRNLHLQIQEAQTTIAELEAERTTNKPAPTGPVPREEELLRLSEELESERRQLQEDEQALMEQMREMELTMARERAEMARQRNDLQRLQGEIRHELERLERNGALQTKIDGLKSKLNDAVTRRGLAPQSNFASPPAAAQPSAPEAVPPQLPKKESGGLFGRLFGK